MNRIEDLFSNADGKGRAVFASSSHPSLAPPPASTRIITLFCWVLGISLHSPFAVDIEDSKTVHHLKKAILPKKPNTLSGIEADQLQLWKVSIPIDRNTKLKDELTKCEYPDENSLLETDLLSEVFPPPGPAQGALHIVVRLPPAHCAIQMSKAARGPSEHAVGEPPRKKLRKLDYDAPEYRHLNVSPSEFAIPRNFRKAMEPKSEVSLHDTNFASLPLILISPIFGRISDDMCTPQEDLRSGDFAPARNLANMLSLLEDEPTRKVYFRKWLLETLEVKLSDNRHELSEPGLPRPAAMITRGILKDVQIDGHVEWKDYVLIISEGKAELGESSGPHGRLMASFRAHYMQERCSYRVGKSCLPAILIAYHGPYIDISGAIVCPNGSVQVEALMPGLRVDCDVRDDRQRNLLAGLVRALTNAFDGLMKFYKSPSGPVSGYPSASGYASGEDDESIDCWFPYRNSYTDEHDTEQTFEYDSRLTQGPLVFVAKRTDPKVLPNLIVVKFTRAYSKAAHNLLAAKGFAPNLFAVEDLAGGWKMVVMEFLLEPDWTMLEMKTHEERLRYKEKLWEALCVIHGEGLVHGDVRGPNILVSKDGDVKLIDFDYCGTHEQVRYPREWDHTNRSVDAKEGDLMRKEHDVFEFNKIFDNSQS